VEGSAVTERQEYMTVKDCAERSGFGVEAIRRAIARKQLRAHKVLGEWRVRPGDFRSFMEGDDGEPPAAASAALPKKPSGTSRVEGRRAATGRTSFRDMARNMLSEAS
jgi:hypothetical protein